MEVNSANPKARNTTWTHHRAHTHFTLSLIRGSKWSNHIFLEGNQSTWRNPHRNGWDVNQQPHCIHSSCYVSQSICLCLLAEHRMPSHLNMYHFHCYMIVSCSFLMSTFYRCVLISMYSTQVNWGFLKWTSRWRLSWVLKRSLAPSCVHSWSYTGLPPTFNKTWIKTKLLFSCITLYSSHKADIKDFVP